MTGRSTFALLCLAAAPVAAQTEVFHSDEGIVLEGTTALVVRSFGACEAAEGRTSIDLWLVRLRVRNESGKGLAALAASSVVHAGKPPCTRFSRLSGPPALRLAVPAWSPSLVGIRLSSGLRPGERDQDMGYLYVPAGDRPEFGTWDLEYEFAPGAEAGAGPASPAAAAQGLPFAVVPVPTDATVELLDTPDVYRPGVLLEPGRYRVRVSASGYEPRTAWIEHPGASPHRVELEPLPGSPGRSAAEASRTPEPLCEGLPRGRGCWSRAGEAPDCYVYNDNWYPGETFQWAGWCEDGLAHDHGELTKFGADGKGVVWTATGRFADGKREGPWKVEWVRRRPPQTDEGGYVNGLMQGKWTVRVGEYLWGSEYEQGVQMDRWKISGPE